MSTTTLEVWTCVDANGDYAVGTTEEAAREKYEEDIGALNEASGFRLVKVNLTVPLPEVIELEVEADEPEEAEAAAAVA
jgi:hypothetical protein